MWTSDHDRIGVKFKTFYPHVFGGRNLEDLARFQFFR
jgi:hypothetical protein